MDSELHVDVPGLVDAIADCAAEHPGTMIDSVLSATDSGISGRALMSMLRDAATELGLTPDDVAAGCRVSPNTAMAWLAGNQMPRSRNLVNLARLLGIKSKQAASVDPSEDETEDGEPQVIEHLREVLRTVGREARSPRISVQRVLRELGFVWTTFDIVSALNSTRVERGLEVSELTRMAGLRSKLIQHWELHAKTVNPSVGTVLRVALALGHLLPQDVPSWCPVKSTDIAAGYIRDGELDKAVVLLTRSLREEPDNQEALNLLGKIRPKDLSSDHFEGIVRLCESREGVPTPLLRALEVRFRGRDDERYARMLRLRLRTPSPTWKHDLKELARLYQDGAGSPAEHVEVWGNILMREPSSVTAMDRVVALAATRPHLEQGTWFLAEAVKAAEKQGIECDELRVATGRLLLEAGRPSHAQLVLGPVIKGQPANREALELQARASREIEDHGELLATLQLLFESAVSLRQTVAPLDEALEVALKSADKAVWAKLHVQLEEALRQAVAAIDRRKGVQAPAGLSEVLTAIDEAHREQLASIESARSEALELLGVLAKNTGVMANVLKKRLDAPQAEVVAGEAARWFLEFLRERASE